MSHYVQSTWNCIWYVVITAIVSAINHLEDACGNMSFEPGVRKCGTINQRCVTLTESLFLKLFCFFLYHMIEIRSTLLTSQGLP